MFQPFFMADFASLINAVRILLTSALEFGRATFPEFAGLERADKVIFSHISVKTYFFCSGISR